MSASRVTGSLPLPQAEYRGVGALSEGWGEGIFKHIAARVLPHPRPLSRLRERGVKA
jgi:hypothetical protein